MLRKPSPSYQWTGQPLSVGELRHESTMARTDIPAAILPLIVCTERAVSAYIQALRFVVHDTARDPEFSRTHLFAYLVEDLFQSAIAIPLLAAEGMWGVARRELRFILESSTKQAVIQHEAYTTSIQDKLSQFDRLLSSASISCKNRLSLNLLEEDLQPQFLEEVGRLYGEGSSYVHLSMRQIQDRMYSLEKGYRLGFEGEEEAKAATDLVARTLAASIVLLLHGVPSYVAGDLLVESDGTSRDWFFAQSRFIASMDAKFDYKHERNGVIDDVLSKRQSIVSF